MSDNQYRCQAMTSRQQQCRAKAEQYLIYPGDGKEYLACKQHATYLFRPYPRIQQKNPETAVYLEGK
jgi:hypothetical protein